MFRKVLLYYNNTVHQSLICFCPTRLRPHGTIQDAQTKEPLSFATIQLQTADKTWYGALSDQNGSVLFSPNYHPENIQQLYLIWDMTS